MKRLRLALILALSVLLSCDEDKYEFGYFPGEPENMAEFNSEYDDFNSYLIVIGDSGPFIFSSNRNSMGANFNLIYKVLAVYMEKTSRRLTLTVSDHDDPFSEANDIPGELIRATTRVNTSYNELGPFIVPQGDEITEYYHKLPEYNNYILMYATDESGDLDIRYTENLTDKNYCAPRDVAFCNSSSDDAYPSIMPDTSALYFCSDREGNFNIYSVALTGTGSFIEKLHDSHAGEPVNITALSSDSDDKCPFICGNMLVFSSDRPGGFGGFDLYYSVFDGEDWGSPVNFGKKINSSYDEYRPFIKNFGDDFENDFMIFSSNRPGGKGGFDLYYVGISRMTE